MNQFLMPPRLIRTSPCAKAKWKFPSYLPPHQASTHLEDFSELVLQSVVLVLSLSGGREGGRANRTIGGPYVARFWAAFAVGGVSSLHLEVSAAAAAAAAAAIFFWGDPSERPRPWPALRWPPRNRQREGGRDGVDCGDGGGDRRPKEASRPSIESTSESVRPSAEVRTTDNQLRA